MKELRDAYQGVGAAWSGSASLLYDVLARRIVDMVAAGLDGALVLDVGAGTGAVCRALRGRGASPIALDTSADMLARVGDAAIVGVLGDMLALPFTAGAFDAAVSAFAISHVDRPSAALAEMGRVVRPGGAVVAGVFGADPGPSPKDIVDEVAAGFGFVAPPWHTTLKTVTEPLSNTPDLLQACALAAGLRDVRVHDVNVDPGLHTPAAVVTSRLGMAHVAPFVESLGEDRRERLVTAATDAVAASGQELRARLLILCSRAAA